jgi:hypothetical protein
MLDQRERFTSVTPRCCISLEKLVHGQLQLPNYGLTTLAMLRVYGVFMSVLICRVVGDIKSLLSWRKNLLSRRSPNSQTGSYRRATFSTLIVGPVKNKIRAIWTTVRSQTASSSTTTLTKRFVRPWTSGRTQRRMCYQSLCLEHFRTSVLQGVRRFFLWFMLVGSSKVIFGLWP